MAVRACVRSKRPSSLSANANCPIAQVGRCQGLSRPRPETSKQRWSSKFNYAGEREGEKRGVVERAGRRRRKGERRGASRYVNGPADPSAGGRYIADDEAIIFGRRSCVHIVENEQQLGIAIKFASSHVCSRQKRDPSFSFHFLELKRRQGDAAAMPGVPPDCMPRPPLSIHS